MPASPDFDPDQLHDEIAELRGLHDRLTEVIGTGGNMQVNGVLTATDPVNGGPETWHDLGTLHGFTLTRGRYRMNIEGELEIDFQGLGVNTNAATETFANAMPAAYRPVQVRRGTCETGRAMTAGDPWPKLVVNTDGTVDVITFVSVSVTLQFNGSFPLD
jgi:hypothetical protein